MRLGRKGTVIDMMFVALMVLVFGMLIVMATYIADKVFTPMEAFFAGDNATTAVMAQNRANFGAFDNIFIFLYFMLNLVPVVFAVFVKHHPVFLIINILLLIVFLIIAPSLSNVMLTFWQTPELAQYAEGGGGWRTYDVMTRVFQYMPYLSVAISMMLMVAMFIKPPSMGSTM